MDFESFRKTLENDVIPRDLPPGLKALWLDARGDWDAAHTIAQEMGGPTGDWIHAYLHRKEGDLSNASYWYTRCGRPTPEYSLEQEWTEIAGALLRVGDN